eukprot:scaffold55548_cov21-Tisochrysis_lutea.AAC.1
MWTRPTPGRDEDFVKVSLHCGGALGTLGEVCNHLQLLLTLAQLKVLVFAKPLFRGPKGVTSGGKPYYLPVSHYCSHQATVAHSHHLRL